MQLTVIVMKVSIIQIRKMDLVFSHGKVETFTRVITKKMKETGMAKCSGQMDLFIKEHGNKEFNMDKEK